MWIEVLAVFIQAIHIHRGVSHMAQLSIDDRNGVRMFAFAVANTNLLCHLLSDDELEPDYLDAIRREPPLLAALFACHLDEAPDPEHWLLERLRAPASDADSLPVLPPDAPGWMGVVVAFADALAEDRLEGVPVPSRLLHLNGGSPLEMVFAVLTNVLDIDAQGLPRNTAQAWHRAAEMVSWLLDQAAPSVPFSDEETALV